MDEQEAGIPDSSFFCRIGGDYKIGFYLKNPDAPGNKEEKVYVKDPSEVPEGYDLKDKTCEYVCSSYNSKGEDCISEEYTCSNVPEEFIQEVNGEKFVYYYTFVTKGFIHETPKLFHCDNTKDLLTQIKIPQSWKDSDLYVYCNDGSRINFFKSNPDFLTSRYNIYKACIIKNLNLNENNTIFYAKEVGNEVVDDSADYFFDTQNSTDFVSNLNYMGNDGDYFKYNDSTFTYYLKYDSINNIFTITKGIKMDLNYNLDLPEEIEDTRVFVMRKLNGKNIYGYEKPLKLDNNNYDSHEISPVYYIKFDNYFGFSKNLCKKSLGMYGLSDYPSMGLADKVYCDNNLIKINSKAFEMDYVDSEIVKARVKAFDLFKNIILNLY
jgi:hypothetical protein